MPAPVRTKIELATLAFPAPGFGYIGDPYDAYRDAHPPLTEQEIRDASPIGAKGRKAARILASHSTIASRWGFTSLAIELTVAAEAASRT